MCYPEKEKTQNLKLKNRKAKNSNGLVVFGRQLTWYFSAELERGLDSSACELPWQILKWEPNTFINGSFDTDYSPRAVHYTCLLKSEQGPGGQKQSLIASPHNQIWQKFSW